MTLCIICLSQNKHTQATALCNELERPVCPEHAYYCNQEEHGTSPLPHPDDIVCSLCLHDPACCDCDTTDGGASQHLIRYGDVEVADK